MKKYYIIIFDPKQQDWDEFRQNGKIVYFKSEKDAQKFGDTHPRTGADGRVFRQGDWQVIGEAKQTMKITKEKLKQIVREELQDLKETSEQEVGENRALDNAIDNRDDNRANRDSQERYEDLYLGLQKLISKVSKNNKVKGYGGELTHAFVDLLYAVETDRLGVGEIFNGLKKINSKISEK